MTFPTATDSLLNNGKREAGPALVLLTMPGHWVIGALANNQWSFAGWGKNNVNALLVQPFINYNFSHGWYLASSPIITANWLAASSDRWTLPIGGGADKIIKLGGKLPINLQLQAFWNAVTPQRGGADWQLRFQVQFLFPMKTQKHRLGYRRTVQALITVHGKILAATRAGYAGGHTQNPTYEDVCSHATGHARGGGGRV